jgi:hypothetical protein
VLATPPANESNNLKGTNSAASIAFSYYLLNRYHSIR